MSFFYPQAVIGLNIRWEDFEGSDDSILKESREFQVLAKRCTVTINDYTKADTFEAELDYKNFPFDPRVLRAVGITIHMEDKERVFRKNNQLDLLVPSVDNTVFQGFVDEENIDFDDVNRIVRFEGRDFTSLLIDAPYDGKAIDLGSGRLDQIIQQLLDPLPSVNEGKLKIDVRIPGGAEALPLLSKFAPDFSPLGRSRSGKKKEFVWDIIKELVSRAALIVFIELDKLVITEPRALYGDSTPTQFVYGRNLKSLNFKRKLGRQKGINIVVRSLNIENKELLEAKIPEEATAEWANSISISAARQKIQEIDTKGEVKEKDAPFMAFNIPNVVNKDQLIEIGQGIYEEIGRQQLEGNLETFDMCALQREADKSFTEKNYLVLRNGSPINLEIDSIDMKELSRDTSVAAKEKFLISRCYTPKVAASLARTLGKFDTRFYTREVEYTMDQDEGFSMRLGFINFIELGNKGLVSG